MLFTNFSINPDQLPKVEDLHYQPLSPAWLRASYIRSSLFILVFAFPLYLWSHSITILPWLPWLLLPLWFFIGGILLWLKKKEYNIRGYSLRQKDILFRKGILYRTITAIPFNRVQHIEVKQGPIDRYFDLHTLAIYTAGGQSSDLDISGLEEDTALRLKHFIIQQTTTDDDETQATVS